MDEPKCKECENYTIDYNGYRTLGHWCKAVIVIGIGKAIKYKDRTTTSPKWCPKRKPIS